MLDPPHANKTTIKSPQQQNFSSAILQSNVLTYRVPIYVSVKAGALMFPQNFTSLFCI